MSTIIYYHNPSCSKSRAGLALLEENNIQAHIRLYLSEPPSPGELKDILSKLNLKASALLRKKEAMEAGIDETMSDEAILTCLSQNPKAIERPILVIDNKAVIGRPTENMAKLIDDSF